MKSNEDALKYRRSCGLKSLNDKYIFHIIHASSKSMTFFLGRKNSNRWSTFNILALQYIVEHRSQSPPNVNLTFMPYLTFDYPFSITYDLLWLYSRTLYFPCSAIWGDMMDCMSLHIMRYYFSSRFVSSHLYLFYYELFIEWCNLSCNNNFLQDSGLHRYNIDIKSLYVIEIWFG